MPTVSRHKCRYDLILAILLLVLSIYIVHKTADYILFFHKDSVLDLQESLALAGRLTVRAKVINESSGINLEEFLKHYSECRIVKAIHILPLNTPSLFDSMPKFEKSKRLNTENKFADVETDAVLLLDSDVFISCFDLEFAYNVWSSGSDAMVGFFPRLVVKGSSENEFIYLGAQHVWWQGAYSLMSSSGVIVARSILTSLYEHSADAQALREVLNTAPACSFLAVPMWAISQTNSPPIWVESYYQIRPYSVFGSNVLEVPNPTNCVNLLAHALNIKSFPYSSHKASKAIYQLFW